MTADGDLENKLFKSIDEGDYASFTDLLAKGVTPDALDENGMTPLMQAAYKKHFDMCECLLKKGAKANHKCHDSNYTPLMMAALSGRPDIINLLLEHGANPQAKNSIDKTASELAAFVGQHESALTIKNFLSTQKLQIYLNAKDEEMIIPETAVPKIKAIMCITNPNPVNVILTIDNDEYFATDLLSNIARVLADISYRSIDPEVKGNSEEFLSVKAHYYSMCINHLVEFRKKHDGARADKLIKKLLSVNGDGFRMSIEMFVRKSMQLYPHPESPAFVSFLSAVSSTKIGTEPTALFLLNQLFFGVRESNRVAEKCCACCDKPNSMCICSRCKKTRYCTPKCQKLHWSVHKKFCCPVQEVIS